MTGVTTGSGGKGLVMGGVTIRDLAAGVTTDGFVTGVVTVVTGEDFVVGGDGIVGGDTTGVTVVVVVGLVVGRATVVGCVVAGGFGEGGRRGLLKAPIEDTGR